MQKRKVKCFDCQNEEMMYSPKERCVKCNSFNVKVISEQKKVSAPPKPKISVKKKEQIAPSHAHMPVCTTLVVTPARKTVPPFLKKPTIKIISTPTIKKTSHVQSHFPSGLKLRQQKSSPHVFVDALAGTGKSTVIKEDVYRKLGMFRNVIQGSDEQNAIWQATSDMDGMLDPTEIFVGAFNTSIANEMSKSLPPRVQSGTWHGFGKKILAMNGIKGAKTKFGVSKNKTLHILADKMNTTKDGLFNMEKATLIFAIKQFVGFCKLNLVKFTGDFESDCNIIRELAARHGAFIPDKNIREEGFFFTMVMDVYNSSHMRTDIIDYDDMLWLPWKLNYQIRAFKMLYGDERQDMNIAQQELFYRHCERGFLAGDVNQAIYGFAGADIDACSRMTARLSGPGRGSVHLPLTYTRRCSQAVVEYAQRFVPDFKFFPNVQRGKVAYDKEATFLNNVIDGDMIICRTNAPLFKCCLKLFQQRRKFRTTVKDDFEKAIHLIKSFECTTLVELDVALSAWKEAQIARCGENEDRKIMIRDTYEAIKAGMSVVSFVDELIQLFYDVFNIRPKKDDHEDKVRKIEDDAIYLTSIHGAKGLEANVVWWLQYDLMPHPRATLLEQERNLQWVASTRAIRDLVLVAATPKKKDEEDEW